MKNKTQDKPDDKRSSGEETPIYLNTESTLQTSEEARKDHTAAPAREEKRDVSKDDLHDDPEQSSGNGQ